MRGHAVLLLVALLSLPAHAEDLTALSLQLHDAAKAYDAEKVALVLSRLRAAGDSTAAIRSRIEAGLTLAELLRITYEQTPAEQREQRRLLGQRIDVAAEEALALLDRLTESSERERLRADLLATLIRSSFRAKKHEGALKAAVAKALALDPDNPKALVTAAKPLLFAESSHGGDPEQALRLLDRALELDPDLEPARLLHAHALEILGDEAAARREWEQALVANPACQPARWRLGHTTP